MKNCRLCNSRNQETLIDFGEHPIVHNLKPEKGIMYDSFRFHLIYCRDCGLIGIENPIDAKILYENYFTVSAWKNQPHVPRLVEVMETIFHPLARSSILEIGCNDGSFLDYLVKKGYENLKGIEPTSDASEIAKKKGYRIEHKFWSLNFAKEYVDKVGKFDIIITRQVLEHIADLSDFLSAMRYALKDDGGLVIEVPDSEWNLDYLDYSLWEEHVNYFTLESLTNLLHINGFTIVHAETTLFAGKALIVYCEKMSHKRLVLRNRLGDKIKKYGESFPYFRIKLREFLGRFSNVAVYGCGARSSNFVNLAGIADQISFFYDDQKEKQNLFVPGCEIQILDPEDLNLENQHILLGVNTENEKKVISKLLNKKASFSSILPPSRFLPDFWKNLIYD